jgi:polar amino acid transport system substrate-binding protein
MVSQNLNANPLSWNDSRMTLVARIQVVIAVLFSMLALGLSIFASNKGATLPNTEVTSSIPRQITVAVVPAPPISLFDAGSGLASGHAIELIQAVSVRAGLSIRFVSGNWATMGAALSSGQADMIVGPVFMSEGRAREFIFSRPLYDFSIVPVVRRGQPSVAQIADLERAGLRVAVGRGGYDSEFVRRNMPQAIVSEFPPDDPNLSMLEVLAGRADVAIVDLITAKRFGAFNPQALVLEDIVASRQFAGFMFRSSSSRFRDFIDLSLRNLEISGEKERIDRRFMEQRIWSALPNVN